LVYIPWKFGKTSQRFVYVRFSAEDAKAAVANAKAPTEEYQGADQNTGRQEEGGMAFSRLIKIRKEINEVGLAS